MKSFSAIPLLILALAVVLPPGSTHSQLLQPAGNPMTELQSLQKTNDDIIKRQEATLKDLTDMTTTAHEVRIYSKRG